MKLFAIDFFCGAGGLTRGLLDAGVKVIAGLDCDGQCRQSFESNNRGARFIQADVRDIGVDDLKRILHRDSFDDMLFAGCAPCQPFSKQRKGSRDPESGRLLAEFGRIVAEAKPAWVLIENVPGLASVKGFSTFRRFLKTLDDSGYSYTYDVLDAKYFGVPQTRRRLVLLAGMKNRVSMPPLKHGNGHRPFVTVRQSISHFPPISAGESHPSVLNHVATSIIPINLERLRHTPHDGGDRRSWPKRLWLACHKGDYQGHTDVYGRMTWDNPAPALTGRCNSVSNGRYGHPEQDRAISLREAAALQTFPDGYVFYGSNKHIAQQIGNAVPVRLATELGKHILNMADLNMR